VTGETEFCLLGPLMVRRRGVIVTVPTGKQQVLLAALLLRAGQPVGLDELVEALWGPGPPPSARVSLQNYVRRLRTTLDDGIAPRIVTEPGGYSIWGTAGELDVDRFESSLTAGRKAARAGAWADAATVLRAGLALWRGDPLSGVPSDALAAREVPRLAEMRLQAVEARIDADLHLARHAEVIVELRQLVAAEPLRERLHFLLMTALHEDGQQAGALAAYRAARGVLVEELGAEPGPDLRRLQQHILASGAVTAGGRLGANGDSAGMRRAAGQRSRPGMAPPATVTAIANGRTGQRNQPPGSLGEPSRQPRAVGTALALAEPAPLASAAPWPTVPRQLPAPAAHFAGRAGELAVLTGLFGRAGVELPETVVISAIDGMPGVGKTALVLQAGHLLADRFPDRHVFVDLHGHTSGQQPADPADVLAALLSADGVDPRYLPPALDARAAMWRNRLAGQRTLLILDNAASSAQVAPLLPGTAGCLVLITSRCFLGDLPAAAEVPLDVLSPCDAATMFVNLAPRAAGEPAAVAELAALCGHLPLAISLLARLFTRHRSWTMADLIAETRAGLLTVTAESQTVAAAFEVSYRHLDADRQRFFRRLGLHPGSDTDAYAAAALAGLPLAQAAGHLAGLLGDRLLEEPVPGRYKMHDLIRQYARDLAAAEADDVREQAAGRLLDYYQHTAATADLRLARYTRPPTGTPVSAPAVAPALPGRELARAWLSAERANLVACIDAAATGRKHARVVGLTAAIAAYLRSDGPWPQAIALHAAAARAARYLDDQPGEGGALLNLGDVRQAAGDYPGATSVLEQALAIFRGIGDRLGEVNALFCLGEVRRSTSDFSGAADLLQECLAISDGASDPRGQASILFCLGDVRQATSDYPGATKVLEQSLAICRRIGNRFGEATALCWLGKVRQVTGDYPGAAKVLEQALEIARDAGSRLGEAGVLFCLADVRQATGDVHGAADALEQSLGIFRRIGSRHGEAQSLCWLGKTRQATGDVHGAADALEQSLNIFRGIGNRLGEGNALQYLASVRQATGDELGAASLLEQSLAMFQSVGDRLGEAEVLNQAAASHLTRGDPQQAQAGHQRALELSRAIGSPLEEARALEGIGKCAVTTEPTGTATDMLRQALAIYLRLGTPDASRLTVEIGTSR
jgi:DNA-binding SARP family transcriptional activator/tetratricopeptide (TPR) repeat protein